MDHPIFREEHEIFRQQARRFVEERLAPRVERWEEEQWFPSEVFREVAEAGFLGLLVPEAYGGAGGDYAMAAVWIEELTGAGAAGLQASIDMHGLIILPYLAKLGSEEQKARFLVPGVRGERIGALGLTEPGAGSDLAGLKSRARRSAEGGGYVLDGSKTFITNGIRASFVVTLCKTDPEAGYGGFSFLIVEEGMQGFVKGRKLKKVGWHSSDTAELSFDGVRIPDSNRLGEEGMGFYYCMENLAWERLLMALGSAEGARRLLAETIRYTSERVAFGRPVGKFQVNRHLLAELATQIEAARAFNYQTLWILGRGKPCTKEAAMCKIFSCEMANRVADRCLQLHGGYGYMSEYHVQRAWRDMRLGTIGGGTTEIMRELVANLMGI